MAAYVIVQHATSRDHATLLADPDIRALLLAHGARALSSPPGARADPGPVPAPAPIPLTLLVADIATAHRLAAALRAHPAIDASYAKPAETAP